VIRFASRAKVRMILAAALLGGLALTAGCAGKKPVWVSASPGTSPAVNVPSAPAVDKRKPQPVPGKVLLGAYLSLSGESPAQSLALRKKQLGEGFAIIHQYYGWLQPMPRSAAGLPAGSTLMISWDGLKYASILDGSQDKVITKAADNLRAYKKPVYLRWAWEMNGSWYDWGGPENGNSPSQFIQAWRYIHNIFVKEKAVNVAFVWAPNWKSYPSVSWNDMANYYPGDAYVDWIGISAYFSGRQTPADLFGGWSAFGSRKPLMIAETGAQEHGGSVKADWIRQLQEWIDSHPEIAALVWFDTDNDHNNGKNWRIDSSPESLAAYQNLARDPRFLGAPLAK
jgi:hypothetical protein